MLALYFELLFASLCRLEIECQIVAKDETDISGIQLETALYRLDNEDPSGAVLVKETTVKTSSNDHWVSVDTSAKINFKEAWYGGLINVSPFSSDILPEIQSSFPPLRQSGLSLAVKASRAFHYALRPYHSLGAC